MQGNWMPPKEGERDEAQPCEKKPEPPRPRPESSQILPARDEEFYRVTGMKRPPPPAPPIDRNAGVPLEEGTPLPREDSDTGEHEPIKRLEIELQPPQELNRDKLELERIQKAVDSLIETVPALRPIGSLPLAKKVEMVCGQMVLLLGMIEKRRIKILGLQTKETEQNGAASNGESHDRET